MFPADSLLSCLLLALSISGSLGRPAAPGAEAIAESVKRDTSNSIVLEFSPPTLANLGNGITGFGAPISIGSPAYEYYLLIDTAHPNTWVGADQPYTRTSTTVNQGTHETITYALGSYTGYELTDKITLSTTDFVTGQRVDDALTSSGFDGFDGVLGMGPGSSAFPTVIDSLYSQGKISTKLFGLSFNPPIPGGTFTALLTLGGVDEETHFNDLEYAPSLTAAPYDTAWGVYTSISYDGTQLAAQVATTIDSLNPYIYLPDAAYNSYMTSTGAILDDAMGMLKIPVSAGSNLQNINIQWGGTGGTYNVQPDAQVWPFYANVNIGGDNDHYYLVIKNGGDTATLGLPFIERFYLAFDAGSSQVGVATTPYQAASISFPPQLLEGGVCSMLDMNYCPDDWYCNGPAGGLGVCTELPPIPEGGMCANGIESWPCANGYVCNQYYLEDYSTCQIPTQPGYQCSADGEHFNQCVPGYFCKEVNPTDYTCQVKP